nr:ATP-binding protein [uncultured Chitinophaga sp.]
MMKCLPPLLLLLLSGLCGRAQEPPGRYNRDSLVRQTEQPLPDSARAAAFFRLAEDWIEQDTIMAKKYAGQGKQLLHDNVRLQGISLYYNARLLAATAPDSAAAIYLQAENKLKPFTDKEALRYRSMCWHDYAHVFHFDKDDPESYINLLIERAIPLALQSGDQAWLGKNYLDLAYGFKNLQQLPKAETYLKQAIETLRNEKSGIGYLTAAYHTLSENNSLSGHPDEAAAYMDSLRLLLLPYPHATAWLDYYAGESMRLTVTGKFDQSLEATQKGIMLARQLKKPYPEQRLQLQQFYALYNKKDLTRARDVALDLTTKKPFINVAMNRLLIYYGLVVTYEELHNIPEAFGWLKRYSHLRDSISQSNLEAKVNALEIKFRKAEDQRKITALNAANDKAQSALKRTRLLNWSLSVVILLLFIILLLGYFFYRNRKKTAAQREQIKVSQAMLQVQEEERQRVARDLHDSLGGLLASTKINLSAIAGHQPELKPIISQLDVSVSELRKIAHNMMPEMLLKLGLEAALQDLCNAFTTAQLTVQCQCLDIRPDIPQQEQVTIYRIIQELLTNAVKHAAATRILLQCNQRDNRFFITVEDDGKGFDTTADGKDGMGFINIRNRVAYLHGSIDIVTPPNGKGTSINIEVYVSSAIPAGHPG